ncbi:hypothetical protein Y032_0125g1293 [Ancylostoma ceylanicum]|uniref:Uncharacterized protein n=1 Tax=Ancylostoma ceylanicum TaxID=53326 RepID=A0A016T941_9BILA|nr:hypothetical protein Y032_0125g1293 [Ancylostoma ceylanicum]
MSRRVSLPVTLTTPRPSYASGSRLSPPSPFSARRRSQVTGNAGLPPHGQRRSLPGTPRNISPRHRALPHLDEDGCSTSRFIL